MRQQCAAPLHRQQVGLREPTGPARVVDPALQRTHVEQTREQPREVRHDVDLPLDPRPHEPLAARVVGDAHERPLGERRSQTLGERLARIRGDRGQVPDRREVDLARTDALDEEPARPPPFELARGDPGGRREVVLGYDRARQQQQVEVAGQGVEPLLVPGTERQRGILALLREPVAAGVAERRAHHQIEVGQAPSQLVAGDPRHEHVAQTLHVERPPQTDPSHAAEPTGDVTGA